MSPMSVKGGTKPQTNSQAMLLAAANTGIPIILRFIICLMYMT